MSERYRTYESMAEIYDEIKEKYSLKDHIVEPTELPLMIGERYTKDYRGEYFRCKKCKAEITKSYYHDVPTWFEGFLNLNWTNSFRPLESCKKKIMKKALE